MRKHSAPWYVRLTIVGIIVCMLSTYLPMVQIADALVNVKSFDAVENMRPGGGLSEIRNVNSLETTYGLVTILVEDDVWGGQANNRSGTFSFLGNTKLKEKITTYAEDIQSTLPWTKTIIVTVADDDSTIDIQRMLEKFYFEGNPDDSDPTKLSGVIVIGDVPLPVVNKNGNRFISVLPYTDFEDPSYILDENTLDFVPNNEAQDYQEEVWHGLIVPPVDDEDEALDMLVEYFDKNHAFHVGDEDYTTFNEKIFVGDFVTEESTINKISFDSYKRFTDLWEEMVYYRYTNDLVEEIYVDMLGNVTSGDGLDNDDDGLLDEEAENGIDDDGDGYIDEDLGDGFFGIDNDGDCLALPESSQDSNGDGVNCNGGEYDEDGNEIVAPDNLVDEDGIEDNNNDEGWVVDFYRRGESIFADRMIDEDPPGDTTGTEDLDGDGEVDGDGCPGLCGVDDNGDTKDHDDDGYPTGWEIIYGYDPFDAREPSKRVCKYTDSLYDTDFCDEENGDSKATTYLQSFFTDSVFGYEHISCLDSNGAFHPEWDDDEDGFCDEDGSDEDQIWVNQYGSKMTTACAYNDADCDGLIDEDSVGIQPIGQFDELPDLQSRMVVQSLIRRYAEIFEQPQGVWNRIVAGTGRYKTRDYDGETVSNDYDTAISLISKKDEYVIQYLKSVNDLFETEVDDVVAWNLQGRIPLIASLQMVSTVETTTEEDGEEKVETEDGCDDGGDCPEFLNHMATNPGTNFNLRYNADRFYIYGRQLGHLLDVSECSIFAGTVEDGGQLVQFNSLYTSDETYSNASKSDVKNVYYNCVPSAERYKEDIEEICVPVLVEKPIATFDGAKDVGQNENWEVGYPACYEFRERKTFEDYTEANGEFNRWLTGELKDYQEDEDDTPANYQEFLDMVEEERTSGDYVPTPGEATLRQNFDEIDLITEVDGMRYTVQDMFNDLGMGDWTEDELDVWLALRNGKITINDPQYGSGLTNVSKITVTLNKLYIDDEDREDLTDSLDEAATLSTMYKHTMPTLTVLNAQAENVGSPNFPIDATRRITFIDANEKDQEIEYINVFDAESVRSVDADVLALASEIGNVAGGSAYVSDIRDMMDLVNRDQLEDAIAWKNMNIDEKHKYILTHYLGAEEAISSKARDGYEIVSIIADGNADELFFAFNGDKPLKDEDLEFQYRSQELIEEALSARTQTEPEYEPLNEELEHTTPIIITEYIEALQDWLKDTKTSLQSFQTIENDLYCGDPINFGGGSDDNDDNGVPDEAEDTVSLVLSTDRLSNSLQANGQEFFVVTVSAKKADGSINTDDNYSEVTLDITRGEDSISVSGNNTYKLTNGVAVFTLISGVEGDFSLKASASNVSGVLPTNVLTGTVTEKRIALSTYTSTSVETRTETEVGSQVEISDGDGNVVAVFDPTTGELDLRGAEAEIREATSKLPTRVAVFEGTETYGAIYIVPDGEVDVEADSGGDVVEDASGLGLYDGDTLIAYVTKLGQIAVADGYYLDFTNPSEINIYDPILILNSSGSILFTVIISHEFEEAEIESTDENKDFLSFDWPIGKRGKLLASHEVSFVKSVSAASIIPDTDGDMLDDLEEFTIGTDIDNADTDGDGYADGLEVFSGYDPLDKSGAALFTDMNSSNPAYFSVATLYLRGIIHGFDDGSFRPDELMTREQFVKVNLGAICVNCENFSESYEDKLFSEYDLNPFPDVDIDSDLLACVAEAKVDEIVSGYVGGEFDGFFRPKRYISRAEATKVLVETAGFNVSSPAAGEMWYANYVRTANALKLFPTGATVTDEWLQASITRAEFSMMAVNLLARQDCRENDTDGDGISDTEEELIYGTDPNLADTDAGGVNDLDEILSGLDPLDGSDDIKSEEEEDIVISEPVEETVVEETIDFSYLNDFSHDEGVFVVSDDAAYEEIAVSIGDGSTEIALFTNKTPADGESVLHVRAELSDQSGNIYVEDNTSVVEFVLSSTEFGEIETKRVQVSKGLAETTFTSSKIAGEVEISATITDGFLPSKNADVIVYPGDPVTVDITGESSVLPAGGEAVSDMRVSLYDNFGNLANFGFYTVTLEVDGGIELLDVFDEDMDADGIQITTPDGYFDFRVLSSPTEETSKISATIFGSDTTGDSYSIDSIDGMKIQVEKSRSFMLAGGSLPQEITVAVVDDAGRILDGFSGDVNLSMSDPNYGSFEETTISLTNGEASASVMPGTLAGNGSIIAESPGMVGGSTTVEIKPADTFELRIRNRYGHEVLKAGDTERFYVEAFDQYGNLVTTDSTTEVSLRLTDATADTGNLLSTEVTLNQGVGSFTARINSISGKMNIVASADSLIAGTWGGDIDYSVTGNDFSEIQPQMLYGSILGGPFGDVTENNYIGGWLTFNGKTQAITTLISEPVPKERLVAIDSSGAVTLPDGGMVSQNILAAGSELPMRLQWRSFPDDTLLGEAFFVVPSVDSAVSVRLISNRPKMELDESGEDIVLKEDSAAVVKIREDGQIVLLDPNYSLVMNAAAEGLGFVVMRTTEQVLRVDYGDIWDTDVDQVSSNFALESWDTLTAGIYVKPTSQTERQTVAIPSGNSSLSPKGLAIINPENDLPDDMQPSLGYASLESAEDNGNIGWENENKHILLFAAGNTVGESNLYYPSEVGVVLGDPTISLPTLGEINDLGFTADVGTMISASNDDVMTLMDIDYNDDGMMDVLAAYGDGRIEVLQNSKAPVRLNRQGPLIFVENGISSIDKGDINGDGMEDLVIVTNESCYADEMCLYIYENIGGGFVAENLSLGEMGKPKQVEVADLNNDDLDDLVIVDENMVLYTVWNSDGELDAVDEIRDFGLEAEESQNLLADVVLRYDGIKDGPVGIALLTEELTGGGSGSSGSAANDFLDTIGNDGDFEFLVDGSSGDQATVMRKVSNEFDYADSDSIVDLMTVTKNVSDLNRGKIEIGDELEFTISIENVSGQNLSDVYVSDFIASSYSFDDESFVCDGCASSADMQKGDVSRPWVYGPFDFASGDEVEMSYIVTVTNLPRLTLMVGQDFYDDYTDDDYADIAVSLEGNDTGTLMVYHSDGYVTVSDGRILGNRYKRMNYEEKEYSPETYESEYDSSVEPALPDSDGDGIPDMVENMDDEKGMKVPSSGYDVAKETMGAVDRDGDGYYGADEMYSSTDDADGDGLSDTIDDWVTNADLSLDPSVVISASGEAEGDTASFELTMTALDDQVSQVTDVVEGIVSKFTCNGGCLALPGSMAFLAPGTFHDPLFGTPVGFDSGTPVFGILGYPPGACTGQVCYGSQVFRLYLAPTTTLGLGLGICLGPYGSGRCFAFSIPLLQALGICDALNNFIADSLSKATAFVSGGENSILNVDGAPGGASDPTGLGSAIFQAYVPPTAVNTNIQVPGFPEIFTEWWKAQKFELFKMLDLPDVTLIYPDPSSIASEFTGFKQKAAENKEEEAVDLHYNKKIEKLTGGINGMENFLNTANALPLVDIKPESVNIQFPSITPEEIEIVKRDWENWLEDTKKEWERFKDDFDARDDLKDGELETFNEINDVVEEAISAMEANLAILESYRDIPQEILKIRDFQAYYARIVICYIDAILSNTAGYLKTNADIIEAWAQFVVDLRSILDGWQVLLDASVKLMDSCDKCTNQRYSGIQILLSLFTFIPDLPVVEMPKLPDIVLDVSNIQAGVDIKWPDVNFVPQSINIPKIPRISLPTAYLDLNIDLDVEIPRLPEFNVFFELPELPGLPLPDLPNLPPPPVLPELDPSIQAAISIASSIIQIICIIRSGFIPVSEFNLKTKIEEITERPGNIVMPFDLRTTVEWPEFSLDFWKRIEINTYINLTADFDVLFDIVDDFADETNKYLGGFGDDLDEQMQDLTNAVQEALDVVGEYEAGLEINAESDASLEGIDSSGSAEGSVSSGDEVTFDHPAISTALAYVDEPIVHDRLLSFKKAMENLQVAVNEWSKEMPENYDLIASQVVLGEDDPLLHRYDEIIKENRDLDVEFLASIQDTPLSALALMRESMIDYVEDLESGTNKLRNMNGDSFQKYLAAESLDERFMLASEDKDFSPIDLWHPEELAEETDSSVFLASSGDDATAALNGMDLSASANSFNSGLYIFNEQEGIAERLINYNQEADENVNILFIDIDKDGDDDVVYSMGGDIYLKENHLDEPTLKYYTGDPESGSLEDLTVDHGAIQNYKLGKNDYEVASFSFDSAEEAVGYEVYFYDSMDAMNADPAENIKRLLLLVDDTNDSISFFDENGEEYRKGAGLKAEDASALFQASNDISILVPKGAEYLVPEIRESRLVLSSSGGSVNMYNGYKRTVIRSSGELETNEDVIFQTLDDSIISVEIEGKEIQIEVPASHWINFGRGQSRVIRVESGEVIWVQTDEVEEEQDVIDGMEILAGEMIALDGMLAKAKLVTSEGAEISLDKQEIFVMDRMLNAGNPNAQIELENGAYYSIMRGVYSDGGFGTLGDNILMSPQVCADKSAPFVILDDTEIDLAIYSTTELSAESSFDTNSEIVDSYWDLDADEDADGDGIKNNDEQVIGLTAEIGPYDDVDTKEVTLWVVDAAGNEASGTVTVNIFVPDLILTSATTTSVSGTTDPLSPEFPFHLVRERDGAVSEIGDGYLTNENGDIEVELNESDLLNVYDADGGLVAQFNPVTKQVLVYDSKYDVIALESGDQWPSRLVVYDIGTGIILASFVIITDNNRFVTRMYEGLDTIDLSVQRSVTVYLTTDDESYEIADEGVFVRDEYNALEVIISQDGNITILDDRYSLKKREADSLDEYLILELYDEDTLEMEIWPGSPDDLYIVNTDDLGLPSSRSLLDHESLSADLRLYFEDISSDDALYDDILELVERGILEGVEIGGLRYFLPDEEINRAEFTKIILGILCIVPGEDSKTLPAVFNDILDAGLWYFDDTKEAYSRDLITGYLGELNSSGVAPFKPGNHITVAEATKIMLEALDKEGVITLPDDLSGEPWYEPYLEIAVDLNPYLVGEISGTETYILTPEEAADPGHLLTRYEFVEMSVRVLQAYNCFDLDSDGDGLINFDEESIYGTDPYNPDSDAGGVDDGSEVGRGTDPLNGTDDFDSTGQLDVEPGIYAVQEACLTCPCSATIDYDGDLHSGDNVFAIIQNEDGEVFGISNKLSIK